MEPIIGITADLRPDPHNERTRGMLVVNWNYAQAVTDAGGAPLIIPPQADPKRVLALIDGLLIPGGNDIDARHWGEENHPAVKPVEEARFDIEQRLMLHADRELPVLGICYGCQLINVTRGGSLIQHLPDEIGHDLNSGGTMQEYRVEGGSKLASLVGSERVAGKSYHHQAVRDVGSGLRVVARGPDGIVEAIEADDRPWMVGVQWHPERTMEDEASRLLFQGFVEAAAQYRQSRAAAAASAVP